MSAWQKMNYQQRTNARSSFETWEILLFEKLKKYGKIDPEYYQNILDDIVTNRVRKELAKEYLDDQIKDMYEQLAEIATKV